MIVSRIRVYCIASLTARKGKRPFRLVVDMLQLAFNLVESPWKRGTMPETRYHACSLDLCYFICLCVSPPQLRTQALFLVPPAAGLQDGLRRCGGAT